MRDVNDRKNPRRGPVPGYPRAGDGGLRASSRKARRPMGGPWPAVVLTVLFCAGILILAFAVSGRRAARISASYGGPTPGSAAPAVRESPDTAGASPGGAAPEGDAAGTQEGPDTDDSSLYRRLEWKEGQFVLVQYGAKTSTELDTSGFTDPSTKNSHDLAEWAKMVWENQWGYVWGTFGYILTEDQLASKLEQYPDDLREYEDVIREKWLGRRVVDCVGLIKSYGWYDPVTNGIEYGTGGMPDTGTDGMWNAAEVKGDIDTMPDEPGLLVYSTAGHIGVYIGDGYVIEAISHAGGVVKTKVADRPWTGWLQCPYIRYDP